jgi:hypothetical protein
VPDKGAEADEAATEAVSAGWIFAGGSGWLVVASKYGLFHAAVVSTVPATPWIEDVGTRGKACVVLVKYNPISQIRQAPVAASNVACYSSVY